MFSREPRRALEVHLKDETAIDLIIWDRVKLEKRQLKGQETQKIEAINAKIIKIDHTKRIKVLFRGKLKVQQVWASMTSSQ